MMMVMMYGGIQRTVVSSEDRQLGGYLAAVYHHPRFGCVVYNVVQWLEEVDQTKAVRPPSPRALRELRK